MSNRELSLQSELGQYSYTLNSKQKNPATQKFSKAHDRFRIPKDKIILPGPGNYSPKITMANESAIFKTNGRAVIGR